MTSTDTDIETADPAPMSREWLESRVAAEALDLARIERQREARRKRLVFLAATRWVMERQAEVMILAEGLAKKPAIVLAKLRSTKHGCDWLIARWKMLEIVTAKRPYFESAERALAQNLLATPAELRGGYWVDPRFHDVPIKEVIQGQIAELEALKAGSLDELDAMDRAGEAEGLDVLGDKVLAALNREAAACQRRMQAALKKLEADARAASRQPAPRAEEQAAEPLPSPVAPATPRPRPDAEARRAERRRLMEWSPNRPDLKPTNPAAVEPDANRDRLASPPQTGAA